MNKKREIIHGRLRLQADYYIGEITSKVFEDPIFLNIIFILVAFLPQEGFFSFRCY